MIEFNYEELLEMTNKEFADDICIRLDDQRIFREIMVYRQFPADDGVIDIQTIGIDEEAPRFIVEYITGWKGVPHAMWRHEFEPSDGKRYSSVISAGQVARYHQMMEMTKKSSEG